MSEIIKTRHISSGAWHTIESCWNAQVCFVLAAGAKVRVRYGFDWLGWDRQSTLLIGNNPVILSLAGALILRAKLQVFVEKDSNITYSYLQNTH